MFSLTRQYSNSYNNTRLPKDYFKEVNLLVKKIIRVIIALRNTNLSFYMISQCTQNTRGRIGAVKIAYSRARMLSIRSHA